VAGPGGLSDRLGDHRGGDHWVDYGGGGAVDQGGGDPRVVGGDGEGGGTSVEGGWEGRVGVGGGVDRGRDVGDGSRVDRGRDMGEGGGDGVEGGSSRSGCDQGKNNEDLHVAG